GRPARRLRPRRPLGGVVHRVLRVVGHRPGAGATPRRGAVAAAGRGRPGRGPGGDRAGRPGGPGRLARDHGALRAAADRRAPAAPLRQLARGAGPARGARRHGGRGGAPGGAVRVGDPRGGGGTLTPWPSPTRSCAWTAAAPATACRSSPLSWAGRWATWSPTGAGTATTCGTSRWPRRTWPTTTPPGPLLRRAPVPGERPRRRTRRRRRGPPRGGGGRQRLRAVGAVPPRVPPGGRGARRDPAASHRVVVRRRGR